MSAEANHHHVCFVNGDGGRGDVKVYVCSSSIRELAICEWMSNRWCVPHYM